MRKKNLWTTIKSELIYWILICIISGFFLYLTNIQADKETLVITGTLNISILVTWFLRIFLLFSGRKISQYSDVIQRISLKNRFFEYFILPPTFLGTLMAFLYFNKSIMMGYLVLILSMFVIFILFINVKSSLRKIYRVGRITRGVFDLICILTFFLFLNILFRFGLGEVKSLLITSVSAFIIFLAELKLHDRLGLSSVAIAIFSSIFVGLSVGCFISNTIFIITAIGTVAFYLIVGLWNVRFIGKYRLMDYIPPFVYSLVALILIFNL